MKSMNVKAAVVLPLGMAVKVLPSSASPKGVHRLKAANKGLKYAAGSRFEKNGKVS